MHGNGIVLKRNLMKTRTERRGKGNKMYHNWDSFWYKLKFTYGKWSKDGFATDFKYCQYWYSCCWERTTKGHGCFDYACAGKKFSRVSNNVTSTYQFVVLSTSCEEGKNNSFQGSHFGRNSVVIILTILIFISQPNRHLSQSLTYNEVIVI